MTKPTPSLMDPAISVSNAADELASDLPDWCDYLESFMPIGDRALGEIVAPDDPQARQEAWRALMAAMSLSFLGRVYADPDYPEFIPLYNSAFNLYAPNPDFIYKWCPVRADGTYRITGYRGSVRFVELDFLDGFHLDELSGASGLGATTRRTGYLDIDSLTIASDGYFSVLISRDKPAGDEGDWFAMPPGTGAIMMRQTAYDWLHERDAILTIQRMDVPPQKPKASAEELASRFKAMASWTEKSAVVPWRRMATVRAQGLINKVAPISYTGGQKSGARTYYEGLFQVDDDEALIVESDVPPDCQYWSFVLTNIQHETVDWINRQSSLNGFQARVDTDGRFRGVISKRDPGVPNWLDPGDNKVGAMQARWNRGTGSPEPTIYKVAFSELRNHLPDDTPHVTPTERDHALRLRREGAQMRCKW